MNVKKVAPSGIKNIISFKNGLKIVVPNRCEIEKGMDLKLKFGNITPIKGYIGEFALVFTLSNDELNFNLYINDAFCDEDDDMNLYSVFLDYGDYDIRKAMNLDKEILNLKIENEQLRHRINSLENNRKEMI